ncbi:MAG: OB-fold nucleic acid binding domain-containing protein [Candidatus Burarchaeum sp.]|nr:OB-fold nucleic acid binding domain-containing protein [Candidatus Burarchaeum sp.]MDO8340273.1 OB-fold nucleic acid binding domain-containing protein [Candidatus Burarchaeum sp.]
MAEPAGESLETDAISDKRLALAALALSLLGLLVLFLYAQSLQPRQTSIGALAGEREGSFVEVIGTVSSASSRGGSVFIRLCDFSDCIAVFVPGQQADDFRINPYLLKPGDKLVVRGVLKEYKGEPELVPLGADGLELV